MFQSLLSWISLIGSRWPWRRSSGATSFNPCCRGSASSAQLDPRVLSRADSVSILVVVDQPHRLAEAKSLADAFFRFQSLLSWISLIGPCPPSRSQRRRKGFNPCCRGSASSARAGSGDGESRSPVSILVVVDQPHRPATGCRSKRCRESFNPCCRGSASSAWQDERGPRDEIRFQSLLSWISLIGFLQGCGWLGAKVFQSLLSWISLIGPEVRPAHLQREQVSILVVVDQPHRRVVRPRGRDRRDESSFNPCCRGSASSAPPSPPPHAGTAVVSILVVVDQPHRRDDRPVDFDRGAVSILVVVDQPHRLVSTPAAPSISRMFQSLLSWISLIGTSGSTGTGPRCPSFNPCCRGSASSARPSTSRTPSSRRCFNPCCRGSASSASRRRRPGDTSSRCFNPCCRGSASSAFPPMTTVHAPYSVSILVVVDQPHRPRGRPDGIESRRMFQSLLSWISLIGPGSKGSTPPSFGSFNPCCRGSASSAPAASHRPWRN